MKLVAVATVAALGATAAQAEIANVAGFSFGATTTTEYTVDAENLTLTVEPSVSYGLMGVDLSASTELSIYDDEFVVEDTFDALPVVDLRAEKAVWDNITVYGETSWDLDASERGEITLGASFAF